MGEIARAARRAGARAWGSRVDPDATFMAAVRAFAGVSRQSVDPMRRVVSGSAGGGTVTASVDPSGRARVEARDAGGALSTREVRTPEAMAEAVRAFREAPASGWRALGDQAGY